MKPRVYVETSVISYLTNRPALDVITAGHQATTYQWWEQQRSNYDLVISQLVVKEASADDPVAAARRRGGWRRLRAFRCSMRTGPKWKVWQKR